MNDLTMDDETMDDETLILRRTVEAGEAPAAGFHHADHVRVAWSYLRQHPLPDALSRFCCTLHRFALAIGKPELYHETITTAYVLLIHERLDGGARDLPWEAFTARNEDLMTWRPSILERYYRAETLQSPRARRVFVMPDRLEA